MSAAQSGLPNDTLRVLHGWGEKVIKFLTSLPSRIQGRYQHRVLPHLLANWVTFSFLMRRKGKAHSLPSTLIISLTSYPARFNKLHLTLKCLLSQSMAADKVILWIAYQDKAALSPAILNLQKAGLEIGYCDDLRSYKKIIPTLQNYPDSFIVTADDDLYYWPTWLEELVDSYKGNPKEVVCHRAHRIRLDTNGLVLPYSQWEYEIDSSEESPLILPTSGGGVLYPPKVFFPNVQDESIFKKLCPQADDIWLYWMIRLNAVSARKTNRKKSLICWEGTQIVSLFHENVLGGKNDEQFGAMIHLYGWKVGNE